MILRNCPDSSLLALAFYIRLFSSVAVTWDAENEDTELVASWDSPAFPFHQMRLMFSEVDFHSLRQWYLLLEYRQLVKAHY